MCLLISSSGLAFARGGLAKLAALACDQRAGRCLPPPNQCLAYSTFVEVAESLSRHQHLIKPRCRRCPYSADPDHDATVLGLPFRRGVRPNLLASARGARSEHVGKRNAALLFEEVGDVVGALGTELPVERDRLAYCSRIVPRSAHRKCWRTAIESMPLSQPTTKPGDAERPYAAAGQRLESIQGKLEHSHETPVGMNERRPAERSLFRAVVSPQLTNRFYEFAASTAAGL